MRSYTKGAFISTLVITTVCARDPFEFENREGDKVLAQVRVSCGNDEHVLVMHENGNVVKIKLPK